MIVDGLTLYREYLCVGNAGDIQTSALMQSVTRMDNPVELPAHIVDELFRASKRVTEEIIRKTPRPTHDGTDCVLVPENIVERLERIVMSGDEFAVDWRP